MKYLPLLYKLNITLFALVLNQCANTPPHSETMIKLVIHNAGSYEMLSPQVCYYENTVSKTCQEIDSQILKIYPQDNASFKIKANQKVRVVLPFDLIHRAQGKLYRPNCHILVDFSAYQDKIYFIEAQMTANQNQPEHGFNCSTKSFEAQTDKSEKKINEYATHHIRYRVPREGESIDGYISNYDWQ